MCAGTSILNIRKLSIEDKKPIQQLLKETDVFSSEEVKVATELMDIYLNDPNQKDYYVYSAFNEKDEIVGYTCFGPTSLTIGTFDLYWIAIKPIYQNCGYGKKLLHFVEDTIKAQNGRLVIVETSSLPKYEKTRIFYIRNKYSELARIKDYYKISDDLIIYGKYLSQ